jgi:hypothetical protein
MVVFYILIIIMNMDWETVFGEIGMKNFIRGFYLVLSLGLVMVILAGCSMNGIPEDRLDLVYLDRNTLESPDEELTYSEVNGEYVHDYIKQNKDKTVRWTATVIRVENGATYELQEPLLPAILVTFANKLEPAPKAGDVLTFTGVLVGYGETFGKEPVWVVRPARLETTTDVEKDDLINYQQEAQQAKEGADLP